MILLNLKIDSILELIILKIQSYLKFEINQRKTKRVPSCFVKNVSLIGLQKC